MITFKIVNNNTVRMKYLLIEEKWSYFEIKNMLIKSQEDISFPMKIDIV